MLSKLETDAMRDARAGNFSPPQTNTAVYIALFALYANYFSGAFSREYARQIKNDIAAQFRTDSKLMQSATRMWKNIESATQTYNQSKSIENADKIIAAIYNLRGD